MLVRITEITKEDKLNHLGQKRIENHKLPSVGDKLYYKTVEQFTVVERHFNLMEKALYDVELFIEKTKGGA